jgi:hypothetical protein
MLTPDLGRAAHPLGQVPPADHLIKFRLPRHTHKLTNATSQRDALAAVIRHAAAAGAAMNLLRAYIYAALIFHSGLLSSGTQLMGS